MGRSQGAKDAHVALRESYLDIQGMMTDYKSHMSQLSWELKNAMKQSRVDSVKNFAQLYQLITECSHSSALGPLLTDKLQLTVKIVDGVERQLNRLYENVFTPISKVPKSYESRMQSRLKLELGEMFARLRADLGDPFDQFSHTDIIARVKPLDQSICAGPLSFAPCIFDRIALIEAHLNLYWISSDREKKSD